VTGESNPKTRLRRSFAPLCAEFKFGFLVLWGQPRRLNSSRSRSQEDEPDRCLVSAHFGQQTKHFDIQPDERHG
jgi:hypothetical protein